MQVPDTHAVVENQRGVAGNIKKGCAKFAGISILLTAFAWFCIACLKATCFFFANRAWLMFGSADLRHTH